jgi:DNA-binding LytR/AlgR family response regulator
MSNKQLTVGSTLKEIEELLNEKEFIRIHRSCIVSIKKIEKIKDNIVYINNVNLPIGKLYREDFYNKILQY